MESNFIDWHPADIIAGLRIGMMVSATAVVTGVDRRKVTFSITARDEKEVIGTATHERFIVAKEKFEAKAQSKKS